MVKNIFLVDDSATMLMSVKALTKLKSDIKLDLIITDINMPNMGGLELIKNVRTLPSFRFTPILTLTTESEGAIRNEGKKLGATGWLVKHMGGQHLIKVNKQVLPGA